MEINVPLNIQGLVTDNNFDASPLSQYSPDNSPSFKSSFLPSEVLLFKGIPGDLRELEVLPLFDGYGPIKDILIAHHKRYLFVQFEDESQAIRCYQTYAEHIPKIRNHDVYVCYTGKIKISKPKALLNPTSRFLHLKFNNNYNEVSPTQVLQILPPYCPCQKLVVSKSKKWEVFLEMGDVFKAILAKDYIQSQSMVNNHVAANFAAEGDLIKEEAIFEIPEESKDPMADDFSLPSPVASASTYDEQQAFSMTAFPCFNNPYDNHGASGYTFSPPYRHMSPTLGPVQNPGSPIIKGRPRMFSNPAMGNVSPILGGLSPVMNGSPLLVPVSVNQFNDVNVLLVKNLPSNITPLMLFRLFGMYGNVMKIKILFNNPEKAFIEFQSPLQAELARAYLCDCTILGRTLKVDFAKKGTLVDISLLKKEPDNQYLGDFSNSSEHRYKYVGSKNHANISPPSRVLHLSNLHPDKPEKFYKDLFQDYGKVKKFMFLKGEEKMALAQMDSVEDALAILMYFHNYDVDGKYMKVSFSKYQKIKS